MKLGVLAVLTTVVVAALATSTDDVINGMRTFTSSLYKEVIKSKQNKNVIFSPITLQTLLSLIMSASQDENQELIRQMRQALSLPYGNNQREAAFREILQDLNRADNDFKVFDATKMYIKSGYTVENWYRNTARNVYGAEIEVIDFGNTWATTQSINQWVAKKTHNNIQNYFDFYTLTANTQNLLINALFLSGKWDKSFVKGENTWNNFYGPYGAKQVEMMNNNRTYDYYENAKAQYLKFQMVREDGGAEMVFVLPKQRQGLTQLEYDVSSLLANVPFRAAVVNVRLPKFSISTSIPMKQVLQNLNMGKLFDWGLGLTGLRDPWHGYVKISDVLQKAVIKIDEWGVTAAAVSSAQVNVDAPNKYATFVADHPFLFYITVDEAIVYAGRVMEI